MPCGQVTAEASTWQTICVARLTELLIVRTSLPGPVLCFVYLPRPSTRGASAEVSATFMFPHCWYLVVAAVSVGFVSRLQGIPAALPSADIFPL